MHCDNVDWSEQMKKWEKDPTMKKESTAGDDRSPAWRWIGSVYHDSGKVCLPSDNLMTMLREGGAKCPTGKKGGSFKRQTQSGLVVDQAAWALITAKGDVNFEEITNLIEEKDFQVHLDTCEKLGFSLFVKRAKIGNNKHIRVRPRFDQWSASGTITVFDDSITKQVLIDILTMAGNYCGVGDWRPSSPKSPGSFGRFAAEVK
jgi:hypothetical protein